MVPPNSGEYASQYNSQAKLLALDEVSARMSNIGNSRVNETSDILTILEDNLNSRLIKPGEYDRLNMGLCHALSVRDE